MALDVHLKRMGNSTWEFRLVGKKGFNISFTEAQVPERRRSKIAVQEEVVYSSPSTESSDEESQPSQEVTSGLYDPVLDDTEVIYETIGPADSDQRSNQLEQPTEVLFEVKQFTDQPDLTRSLTSSPFLISTKPYRPFSTEPLEVPPVEDPIILNPNYHDVFVSHGIEEQPPETRFKLPISEQYDPQYDPNKVLVSNKIYVVQSDETKETKQGSLLEEKRTEKTLSLVDRTEYNEKILKDDQRDYEYVNKMKTEIDLDKIEATALSVVEESIQQAVTVAEDIKKEIDIELTETVHKESHTETVLKESTQTETKTNVIQKEESIIESKTESSMQEQKSNSQKQSLSVKEIKEVEKLINDLPEIIDMTTDEIIQQKESVNIEVNEVDETNKILEKKLKTALAESEYKHDEQVSFEKSIVNEENDKIISKSNLVKASESKITKSDEKASETKANGSKMTTSKLLAEQRAYTIGLQTIPHIKGSVQSSYHYNLLLKTFFVHLTDVMVALSRFILTEPVTIAPNKDVHAVVKGETESSIKAEKQNECKKTLQEENIVSKDIEKAKITEEDTQKDTKSISNSEKKVSKTAIVKDDKVMTSDKVKITSENNNQKNVSNYHHTEEIISDEMTRHELKVEEGELIRKRKLSGAKIAQIEGRKPADLTNRMDKVISEFQKKSGTNEVITKEEYIEDHRRSRSRSRVGEEVIHENLSLESTTQADSKKKSMEVSEVKSEKCLTESVINKHESHASENLKTNGNGKLTYVAIVEAHVYTNKDAIFEEQMRRMSESSKVESSSFERADYKSGVTSKSSEVKKMSVINDAKEESVEELLLAKKIESSTTSSLHKSSAELEKSVTNVALQKTIDLIEPLGHIETEKKVNVMQAHATIEAPVKLIAAQTLVTLEEEHKIIQKEQLFSEKSHTLIEKPVKVVAEKSEIITEDNIEVIEVPKVITKSPKQVIEAPVKVVAEVKEVFINEEKAVAIETPALNIVKPKSALDTTVKAVAEKTEVLVGDNIGSLEAISFKPVKQAKIVVNESVAAVVTEMAPLEPQDEVLKVSGISMKQSKAVIQEPVFHIPETEEINLEESKGEIEIPKVTTLKANVQVEVAKVAAQAKVVALEETEKEFQEKLNLAQKSAKILIEEPVIAQAEVQTVKVEDAKCEITDVTDSTKNLEEAVITEYSVELPKEHEKTFQEEHAELKVTKHQIIEVTPPVEVYEDFDFDMKKIAVGKELSQTINIHEQNEKLEATSSSTIQSAAYKKAHAQSEQHIQQTVQSAQSTKMESQESRYKSSESSVNVSHAALSQKDYQVHTQTVQEKRQHADLKLVESSRSKLKSDEQRKLTLRTDLTETKSINANGENDQSPSPTSVPPTPLVDEYVFKLEAILPKNRGTPPVPRDCSVTPPSEHEDLNIVKKKLVPQIVDTNIEQVIYDPPLPTPTSPEKKSPPKYVKPGLRGGSDRPEITKEEIMDIERKSSLLTSAIDETIRSIEEYKESVGIDVKQGVVEEQIKTEFSSEIETEETSEQNGEVIISNGYVEENEQELNGSEDERHETIIEETENHVGTDETEQSIEQTVVFNGRITNGTNGLSKSVDIEFNEDKQEDIVETVTINLSKIKRDSLQETNVSTTLESNEIKEDVILNGDKYDSNNTEIELNNSDQTDRHSEQTNYSKTEKTEEIQKEIEIKTDPLQGYRSVEFNPEAYKQRQKSEMYVSEQVTWEGKPIEVYKTDSGEIIGSQQGIIDGLEEPVVDPEIAKELGKPGMPEEKIAELISGEAEMLREAHVMGLARVLKSHMHRTLDDDSSVDFMKIKPSIESLKDSEVLKALNEEILRSREEKKKEERKWTTFLQKPVWKPKQKVVFCGNKEDALNYNFENLCLDDDTSINGDESYRVKIVKQPKPRIAPDYKPEDFDTGPLPWEQRAVIEEKEAVQAPPVEPEEPILIPEDVPEFVEAVDPLPESEVPDLEDTGIPLPPPALPEELPTFTLEEPQYQEAQEYITEETDKEEQPQEEAENLEEMDKNNLSEQLMANIESMVDPNATLEEQLAQMRAQLAALAQLPNVIQQTLELVTKQICQISQQKTMQTVQQISENQENYVDAVANFEETQTQQTAEESTNEIVQNEETPEEPQEIKPSLSEEEQTRINREEEERMIEEQKRLEQQKKELIEQMRIEQESRLVKQRSTPRVGKPRPMFGPPVPAERPVVLPGGRKWRKPEDAYNEQLINEALTAQAEVIKGKAIGSFESEVLPYDERVNFMKYEKPPVSLDHLQQSEVYKVVHNMDQAPLKKVEMLTPVIAEADYRERKIKSRFSPVSSVANRWPSRGCSPSPQSEICNSMQ